MAPQAATPLLVNPKSCSITKTINLRLVFIAVFNLLKVTDSVLIDLSIVHKQKHKGYRRNKGSENVKRYKNVSVSEGYWFELNLHYCFSSVDWRWQHILYILTDGNSFSFETRPSQYHQNLKQSGSCPLARQSSSSITELIENLHTEECKTN